jgi:hypothetical protein
MPQQLTAIDLLVSGKTITDTALALDVRRQTVSEWTNHNPTFQAALNSRRQEIWNGTADRLRGLLPRAGFAQKVTLCPVFLCNRQFCTKS